MGATPQCGLRKAMAYVLLVGAGLAMLAMLARMLLRSGSPLPRMIRVIATWMALVSGFVLGLAQVAPKVSKWLYSDKVGEHLTQSCKDVES